LCGNKEGHHENKENKGKEGKRRGGVTYVEPDSLTKTRLIPHRNVLLGE
jgi:hypothetical protein